MRTKLGLGAAAVAVAFFSHVSGLPAGAGVAAAAPLGAQAGLAADGSIATLAQFRPPSDDDDARRRRDRDSDAGPGPGVVKPGGKGGDGKKGAKGGGKWSSKDGSRRSGGGGNGFGTGLGYGIGGAIGGAIIMGAGQCAAQSDRCVSRYGSGTSRYRRCMSDGGC